MYTATRQSAATPSDGSRTLTTTQHEDEGSDTGSVNNTEGGSGVVGALRLRGAHRKRQVRQQRVVWDETVVDNEGCGKKKSKICCIYHKPRRFDESSDESSDSDADSDDSCAGGRHNHDHRRPNPDSGGPNPTPHQTPTPITPPNEVHDLGSDTDELEPNAYEKQPVPKKKGKRRAV